jgi:WD40 repeat protein
MKRLSYKKNNKIINKRLSKINGGRPPVEDNGGCNIVATLVRYSGYVSSLAFHPTAPLLATGCTESTVKLWRLSSDNSSATCVATLAEHIGVVSYIAFHPTAPLLASGSSDKTVKFWRLSSDNSSATCVATLQGHRGCVNSAVKLWRCKILIGPYNNFILYPKKTGISESICNKLCTICNLNLCMKNSANPNNNSNGYVVKLTNGTPSNDLYIHFKCLYRYLLMGHLAYNHKSIQSETIHELLNIDNKANAIIVVDFYN